MKLFIDPRIRDIYSIKSLEVFFEGFPDLQILPLEETSGYFDIDDISKTNSWVDFVRDFVEYYMGQFPKELSLTKQDGTIHYVKDIITSKAVTDYITCRLYAAKGYPELFEVLKELLTIANIDFNIEADFEGIFLSNLHSLKFNTLDLDNIITKLLDALFYLILFGELQIVIDNLVMDILLEGKSITVSQVVMYHELELENVDS